MEMIMFWVSLTLVSKPGQEFKLWSGIFFFFFLQSFELISRILQLDCNTSPDKARLQVKY